MTERNSAIRPHICPDSHLRPGLRQRSTALRSIIRLPAELRAGTNGDAVVEAAILFPIILMIFAALVLLATYLPTRAALQRATQYAATALATESSDTWLFFDASSMTYYRAKTRDELSNVYVALFPTYAGVNAKGGRIVTTVEESGASCKAGDLTVKAYSVNKVLYTEIIVTATREFTTPVKLGFIRFPEKIPICVTSTAVVQNGDEFVRNMDIAVDFTKFLRDKFKLNNITEGIGSGWQKVREVLGW